MIAADQLSILQAEIRAEHVAALAGAQTALDRVRRAGTRLVEAKPLLPHGQWLPWLDQTGIPARTAQDYMRLARMTAEIYATVAHLGVRDALRVLAGSNVSCCTGDNEWNRPAEWIDRGREVLGGIDLDPASNAMAQQTVRAAQWYDKAQDGLQQPWRGRVWLNPPYGRGLVERFVEKLIAERQHVTQAIALTHNHTDARWFHDLMEIADAIAFPQGRIPFNEDSQPPFGSLFSYIGGATERFREVFQDRCLVLPPRWGHEDTEP